MPLFLCAGTPRSGSTWLYNAMRLILTRRFASLYSCWIGELDQEKSKNAQAILIKLHGIDEDHAQTADVILTCHRDLRDVAASFQSMGWAADPQQLLSQIRNCRSFHEYWSPRAQLDLPYGVIMRSPATVLLAIAKELRVDLNEREAMDLARTLEATPNNRDEAAIHDHEYLTHTNHRNDGREGRWKDQLDNSIAEAISEEHRLWLVDRGFDPSW